MPSADSFLAAAQRASRVYANHEAVELCRRSMANARKLRGNDGQPRILAAALELANLHVTLSQFEVAIGDFEVAESAAERA